MALSSASGILILSSLIALTSLVGRVCAGPARRVGVHSPVERLVIYWLLGIIVVSWIGTILAVLSVFRWWLFLAVLLVVGGWALWRERKSDSSLEEPDMAFHPTPWPALLLLVVLLSGAGWLFARPAQSFLLTDDSAVYTIGGIVLARDGSLFFEPERVYQSPGDTVPLGTATASAAQDGTPSLTPYIDFLHQFFSTGPAGVSSRHLGPFYQWTLTRATMEIGFLPLPKVWAALVVWLFGRQYAIWPAPFFGLAGLAALYALVRRLMGWRTGLAAVLLLGLSFPQIWFARFPISEAHTQALFLGGVYLAVLARQHSCASPVARALAIWSGLALAALTVLRFEAVLVLFLLVALFFASWWREDLDRKEIWRSWAAALAVGSALGLSMGLSVAPYYYFTRIVSLMSPELNRLFIVGLLGLAGLGALLVSLPAIRAVGFRSLARRFARPLPSLVGVAWALWGALAAWRLLGGEWGNSLPGWIAQYWTLPALALSIAGALWLIWREQRRPGDSGLLALLGIAVFFLHLYSLKAMVNPVHPWAMRRLVPIIVPVLAVCAAAPLTHALDCVRWTRLRPSFAPVARWLARIGLALSLLALAFGIFERSWPILLHEERQGLWAQLETLAGRFPAGAVLLFDDSPIGKRLTQVMELIFGFPSYVLRDTDAIQADSRVVDRLVESAIARDRPVYLVLTGDDLRWRPDRWLFTGEGAQRFSSPILRPVWGRPPNATDIVPHAFLADVYSVSPAGDGPTRAGGTRASGVLVGPGGYPYLRSGFHRLEVAESNQDFRWTGGDALVVVPWPDPDPTSPADLCLRIDVSGWRPAQAEPAHLTVKAEGITLFDQEIAELLAPGTLAIPAESVSNQGAPQLEIRIGTNTWSPAALGAGSDPRDLGIRFFGLQVSPLLECSHGSSFEGGFHALETTDAGASYRWTDGDATFTAPWPGSALTEAAAFCLTVDLSSWRPSGVRSPHLLLEAEGLPLFDQELDTSLGRYVLRIPAESISNQGAPELEIRIATDTWSPRIHSGGRDQRELGIMIYGIEIAPPDQCTRDQ